MSSFVKKLVRKFVVKEMMYTKVELINVKGTHQVAWIPDEFARMGKGLVIDDFGPCVVLKAFKDIKQPKSVIESQKSEIFYSLQSEKGKRS